jgi:hypothetical protein
MCQMPSLSSGLFPILMNSFLMFLDVKICFQCPQSSLDTAHSLALQRALESAMPRVSGSRFLLGGRGRYITRQLFALNQGPGHLFYLGRLWKLEG